MNNADSAAYEKATRLQSACADWHALRKNRLTASNFKAVASRAKNFEVVAKRFSTWRNAFQHGETLFNMAKRFSTWRNAFQHGETLFNMAKRFSTWRNIQTTAMQYGVDHENEACQAYGNHLKVNIYAVGFIISRTLWSMCMHCIQRTIFSIM